MLSGNAEDEDGVWNQEIAVQPTDVCTSVIICCNGRLDGHHAPNGWPNFRNILLGGASPPNCHALCVPVHTHRALSFSSSPSFSVFFLFLSHGSFTPGSRLEATGRPFFVRLALQLLPSRPSLRHPLPSQRVSPPLLRFSHHLRRMSPLRPQAPLRSLQRQSLRRSPRLQAPLVWSLQQQRPHRRYLSRPLRLHLRLHQRQRSRRRLLRHLRPLLLRFQCCSLPV
ncbi:hypothetical protein C8Q74DRAFT_495858 [Fomes fomentarius]|nr:hypothetical protein C8Q74DRAFT_495858 [Fomes fomentarius]